MDPESGSAPPSVPAAGGEVTGPVVPPLAKVAPGSGLSWACAPPTTAVSEPPPVTEPSRMSVTVINDAELQFAARRALKSCSRAGCRASMTEPTTWSRVALGATPTLIGSTKIVSPSRCDSGGRSTRPSWDSTALTAPIVADASWVGTGVPPIEADPIVNVPTGFEPVRAVACHRRPRRSTTPPTSASRATATSAWTRATPAASTPDVVESVAPSTVSTPGRTASASREVAWA